MCVCVCMCLCVCVPAVKMQTCHCTSSSASNEIRSQRAVSGVSLAGWPAIGAIGAGGSVRHQVSL